MDVFSLAAKITLDTNEYENALGNASEKTSSFGGKLKSGFVNAAKVASAAIATCTAAIGAFAAASIKTGMEFDSSISQVAATMGKTTDEIQNLRDFALEMGSKTVFSATEAADALNYMALAGYDAEESMQALPNVLNLAAAGSIDLAAASDMVTDAQSALGLSMDESADLVDKMAEASSKSNTSIAQLGEAILTIGGTAKNLAGGTTELTTALGILADNGIKGAEGGTLLRNIILSLGSPTDKAAKRMKQLGIEVYDADGNMRPLNETFKDLDNILSTMSQGEKTQILNEIFNKVDLKGVEALLANTGERFDELSGYIDNATGAAERMAETQLDNLSGDITLFKSALESAQIVISDKLMPNLRDFVQFATDGISDVTDAFQEGGLDAAMETIGNLLSELLNKFIEETPQLIDAGMQLVGAIGQGILDNLPMIADTAVEILSMLVNGLVDSISGSGEGESLADVSVEILTKLANGISENVSILLPAAAEAVMNFAEELTSEENLDNLIDSAIELLESIAQGISDTLYIIGDKGPEIIGKLGDALIEHAPDIQDAALNIAVTLADAILDNFSIVGLVLPDGIIGKLASWIGDKWEDTKKIGKNIVDAIVTGTVEAWEWMINAGKDLAEKVKEGIETTLEKIKNVGKDIVQKVSSGVTEAWEQIKNIGKRIVDGIKAGLVEKFSAITSAAKNLFGGMLTGVQGFLKIKSPSKLFRDEVGQYIALGIAEGIDDKTDDAVKAADDLAKEVYNKSKDWADKQVKYTDISLREQLELWETIQSQFIETSKQYADAEEKIFDLRQQILKENEKLVETYQSTFEKRSQEIFNSYKLFDEIPERQRVSGQQLIKNLRGQVNSIETFYTNLITLQERGVPQLLVEDIRSMGIGAADELTALLSLSDKQLSEYAQLYGEKQALANKIALEELEGLREDTEAQIKINLDALEGIYETDTPIVGEAFTDGLSEGIRNGISTVIDASIDVARAAIRATKETLGIHSPSKVFEDIGENMAKGLSEGWKSEFSTIKEQIMSEMDFGTATVDFSSSSLGMASSGIINSIVDGVNVASRNDNTKTFNFVLPDGSKIASYLFNPIANYGAANGTPILNPT